MKWLFKFCKWLSGNQLKPLLIKREGRWYCAYGAQTWGNAVLAFGPLGQGKSPTEAYWSWVAQGGQFL